MDRTTLDGSKSTDDQKIATYHWKQIKSVRQAVAVLPFRVEPFPVAVGAAPAVVDAKLSVPFCCLCFRRASVPPRRGPEGVKIENADSAVATVTGLEVGTYEFTLTVTDERKLQSSDTVTVIVREGEMRSMDDDDDDDDSIDCSHFLFQFSHSHASFKS